MTGKEKEMLDNAARVVIYAGLFYFMAYWFMAEAC
jgi:hypothetical protein